MRSALGEALEHVARACNRGANQRRRRASALCAGGTVVAGGPQRVSFAGSNRVRIAAFSGRAHSACGWCAACNARTVRHRLQLAARPRTRSFAGAVCVVLGAAGCVNTTREVSLPPQTVLSLERGDREVSPVSAPLRVDGDIATGKVEWATTCRWTLVERTRIQTTIETRGSKAGGVVAAVGAGVLGTSAVAWFLGNATGGATCAALSSIPLNDSEPSSNDCAPSETGPAILGVASLVLLATSVALLASKPTTTPGPVSIGPPGPPRLVADNVACSSGAVAGLGVALYRREERIAATTTDEAGTFKLRLPAGLSGSLVLVVDQLPRDATLLHRGDVLARVELASPP